ncbi:MAG: Ig-like domain-containing protein [Oscillospiraceae bacterium]|nr:Ig-like domain-containing protein [Oscillospiraceae bacterium]
MKHIRILSLGMALVMSCSLLTACGPKNNASSSAGSSQPDVSISKPDASAPDQSKPGQGDVSTPVQPQPEVPAEQSISLNKTDFTLKSAGASYKLKASFTGTEPAQVVWTSSDEAVATVDENGVVTAVAAGTATITACAGQLTASCVVRCTIKEDKPVSGGADVSVPDQSQPEQTPDLPAPDQSKPDESPAPEIPSAIDLNAFYQSIFDDPSNYTMLIPMDDNALDAFYPGLTTCQLNQRVAIMPKTSAVPCEIVMVECANSYDVENVKTIFRARIKAQVEDHFNYPPVIEAWQTQAKVVSNGNFVALFVVDGMTDDVAARFNALF